MDLERLLIVTAEHYKPIFSNKYKSNKAKASKKAHTKNKER